MPVNSGSKKTSRRLPAWVYKIKLYPHGLVAVLAVALAVAAIGSGSARDVVNAATGSGSGTNTCHGYAYGDSKTDQVKLAICQQSVSDFQNIPAKLHHKNGRVNYSGLVGKSEAEKIQKLAQYAAEDPVVVASVLDCLAHGSYKDSDLTALARLKVKPGSKGHKPALWAKYYREVQAIVSNPQFKVTTKVMKGGSGWNEGRVDGGSADGTRTSSPINYNGERANVMTVPTQTTWSGHVVKGGDHTSLERCINCQTNAPVGIATKVPGNLKTSITVVIRRPGKPPVVVPPGKRVPPSISQKPTLANLGVGPVQGVPANRDPGERCHGCTTSAPPRRQVSDSSPEGQQINGDGHRKAPYTPAPAPAPTTVDTGSQPSGTGSGPPQGTDGASGSNPTPAGTNPDNQGAAPGVSTTPAP